MRLSSRFTITLLIAAIVPLAAISSLVGRDLMAGWRHESVEAHRSEAVLAAFAVEVYLKRTVRARGRRHPIHLLGGAAEPAARAETL